MVLTIKKRLLVLRSGSSRPLGSLPRCYPNLSGGASWKTNRNFSGSLGGLPGCSKAWRQHMHIERILSALCLWTVGKGLVELGEETAGLSPPGHNTCWEKSNSPIGGLCTLPPYFFASTALFHYILVHFILSAPHSSLQGSAEFTGPATPTLPTKSRFTPFTEIFTPISRH